MQILDLPNELMFLIFHHLDDEYATNALLQTNKRLYALLNKSLYIANAHSPAHQPSNGRPGMARSKLHHGIDTSPVGGWSTRDEYEEYETPLDDHGYPVALAAKRGHYEIVKLLLEAGAPSDEPTDRKNTPLSLAAEEGHLDIVKMLVRAGCNVNAEYVPPVCYAARDGRVEVVQYLLDNGADPNTIAPSRRITALELAAWSGHSEVIKVLLNHGADPYFNHRGPKVMPLCRAVDNAHFTAAETLRDAMDLSKIIDSGDPNDAEHILLLVASAACGWDSILRAVLERGTPPDATVSDPNVLRFVPLKHRFYIREHRARDLPLSALAFACFYGRLEAVKILLEHNVSLGEGDEEVIQNSFVLAVMGSHVDVITALLDHGANPNYRQQYNECPLMWAATSPEVLNLLLDRGATLELSGQSADSILEKVLIKGAVDGMKTLQRRGILASPLIFARLALGWAVSGGTRMVEYLLDQGYKVEPNGEEAQRALSNAVGDFDVDMINLLYARGLVYDLSAISGQNIFSYLECSGMMKSLMYYPLLLDHGTDPFQGEEEMDGKSPFLEAMGGYDARPIIRYMLKTLDGRNINLEELKEILDLAEEEAIERKKPDVIPLLHRAYWRKKYEGLP
ncbi:hypothetical protein N7450_004767 [Penicillium hetheringtonii]|uniref:F-box domain-containing protein n=1 Tax=Penicillium hetheringtonii TaxID=911720 RepID=A0AAD6DQL7_9EURO|nr:hypothetical protein N7450_004767 [Penicillium hetheringtonii]